MRALAWPIVIALVGPSRVFAQGTDTKAAAEALFTEGRRLMTEGRYGEACKKLEASQRLDPGAGTLLNLAACFEKNGQTASAWVTYKEAAAAAQARHPEWVAEASARVVALEPALAKLTIDVRARGDVTVTRDGAVVDASAFGVAIPVDPGAHVIEARAPRRKPFRSDVTLRAKDALSVTVPELEAQPAEARSGGTGDGSGQRVAGAIVMGTGAAGVALGAVFGLVALGRKSDAQPMCTADFKTCSPIGKGAVDDAKSMATASTVSFIAGGLLAAGGLVLFMLAPRERAEVRVGLGELEVRGAW